MFDLQVSLDRCEHDLSALAVFQQQVYGRDLLANTEVAPPAMLPIAGAHGHVRRNRGHAAFLNSRGEVTAYNPRGHMEWQVRRLSGSEDSAPLTI